MKYILITECGLRALQERSVDLTIIKQHLIDAGVMSEEDADVFRMNYIQNDDGPLPKCVEEWRWLCTRKNQLIFLRDIDAAIAIVAESGIKTELEGAVFLKDEYAKIKSVHPDELLRRRFATTAFIIDFAAATMLGCEFGRIDTLKIEQIYTAACARYKGILPGAVTKKIIFIPYTADTSRVKKPRGWLLRYYDPGPSRENATLQTVVKDSNVILYSLTPKLVSIISTYQPEAEIIRPALVVSDFDDTIFDCTAFIDAKRSGRSPRHQLCHDTLARLDQLAEARPDQLADKVRMITVTSRNFEYEIKESHRSELSVARVRSKFSERELAFKQLMHDVRYISTEPCTVTSGEAVYRPSKLLFITMMLLHDEVIKADIRQSIKQSPQSLFVVELFDDNAYEVHPALLSQCNGILAKEYNSQVILSTTWRPPFSFKTDTRSRCPMHLKTPPVQKLTAALMDIMRRDDINQITSRLWLVVWRGLPRYLSAPSIAWARKQLTPTGLSRRVDRRGAETKSADEAEGVAGIAKRTK